MVVDAASSAETERLMVGEAMEQFRGKDMKLFLKTMSAMGMEGLSLSEAELGFLGFIARDHDDHDRVDIDALKNYFGYVQPAER